MVFKRDERVCNHMLFIDIQESIDRIVLVQTARQQCQGLTKRDDEDAKLDRNFQEIVTHPSEKHFEGMASNNILENCPIKTNDATGRDHI